METKYQAGLLEKRRAEPYCFASRNQKRPGRHFLCFLETKHAQNPGLFHMFPFPCVSTSTLIFTHNKKTPIVWSKYGNIYVKLHLLSTTDRALLYYLHCSRGEWYGYKLDLYARFLSIKQRTPGLLFHFAHLI